MKPAMGHWVAHLGIALVCFSRAFAYSNFLTPAVSSPGPIFLTDDGQWLWVYVLMWLTVGTVAVVEAVRPRSTWTLPAFVGIMTVWGLSYIGAWLFDNAERDPWMTAFLYLGVAAFALGAHLRVTFQERKVAHLTERIGARITGSVNQVRKGNHE